MSMRTETRGPVLVVTLDRAEAHNALDAATAGMLKELFERLAFLPAPPPGPHDPAAPARPRVVVLRAQGPTFCAGADLNEMQELGRAGFAENLAAAKALGQMFRAVRLCPAPVVARVQGPAFGGGVGLMAACDIVVASSEARFAFTEARLGIVAGVIAPIVMARIHEAACRHWFLTGDAIHASAALRVGLVDRLADPGELDDAVTRVVRSLLMGGSSAHARIKQLLEALGPLGFEGSLDYTARMLAEARTGEEAQAAMAAFLGKNPAPWTAGAGTWTLAEPAPDADRGLT